MKLRGILRKGCAERTIYGESLGNASQQNHFYIILRAVVKLFHIWKAITYFHSF